MVFQQKRRLYFKIKRPIVLILIIIAVAFVYQYIADYESYRSIAIGRLIMNSYPANATEEVPKTLPQQQGVNVYSNDKAQIDATNLSEGYLLIKYTGGKSVPIKLQITKKDGITYTYNLDNSGKSEIFSLTEGDGEYQVNVMENIGGTKYTLAFGQSVRFSARSSLLPFMYPNQFVDYSNAPQTIAQAKALTSTQGSDLDKLSAIYQYIVKNFTYDYDFAKVVASGYVPKIESVLASKKGICFDYASLTCAMLRSQGIPSKLVIGYAGDAYHAWINVYIETIGWIEQVIYFDGRKFYLMDPTFASGARLSPDIYKYIGDGANYRSKYVY